MTTESEKSQSNKSQESGPKPVRVETVMITSALYENGVRELSVGVRSELEGVPATMNEDELKGILVNALIEPSIQKHATMFMNQLRAKDPVVRDQKENRDLGPESGSLRIVSNEKEAD